MNTKWMRTPAHLIARGVLAAAGVLGLLGSMSDARANIGRERAALEKRVAIVRDAMQLSNAKNDSAEAPSSKDRVAQWVNWNNWGNWPNWGNWNNWPNWNNWGNWFNFR